LISSIILKKLLTDNDQLTMEQEKETDSKDTPNEHDNHEENEGLNTLNEEEFEGINRTTKVTKFKKGRNQPGRIWKEFRVKLNKVRIN
ncbi:4819_t:CDS:2, partial [Scutellospora calospora]